jgi:hypothetical protein
VIEPQEVVRLSRWIGQREGGAARLTWSDGEIVLRVFDGRVRFVEGIETVELGRRLGCEPTGRADLLEEARALASEHGVSETQAMGAAKELLQGALRAWLLDPERDLEIDGGEPEEAEGPTISITHTLVELVLSDTTGQVASAVLPDLDVLLNRSPGFLDLYAPLRLSEEADLIVSKITGERTAREIAERSPHNLDEVVRLLAGLVATGILEPEPASETTGDIDLLPAEPLPDVPHRRLPVMWIAIAAAVLLIVLGGLAYLVSRTSDEAVQVGQAGEWGLVIDMGCEPQDLQRVLKKARENPKTLRPVAADVGGGDDPCWRLVWGSFESREAAEAAVSKIPPGMQGQGFEPHAIELPGEEAEQPTPPED